MKKASFQTLLLSVSLLLCLLLLPTLALAESAATPALTATFTLPEGETVSAFCADDEGGFYVLSSSAIYHWRDGVQDAQSAWVSARDDVVGLCCCEGTLYGMTREHTAVRFDGQAWNILGRNTDGRDELTSCHMAAACGKIFYTYNESQGDLTISHLISIDIATGEAKECPAFDGIELYADEAQGCVYHLSPARVGTLQVFDTANGTLREEEINGLPAFLNSYYDPTTQTFYVTTREGIYRYQRAAKTVELLWAVKRASRIIPLRGGRIAVVTFQAISVYDLQQSAAAAITVMGYESVHERAFAQQSGIAVEHREMAYATMMDEVAQRIAAQDSGVDIYAVWSDEGFFTLRDKGYFTDLSQDAALSGTLPDLFPAFQQAIKTADGRIAAWPVFAYTHLMAEEASLLDAYQLKVPATFDELLDLIPRILDSGMLEDNGYVMFDTFACNRDDLLRLFLRQYVRDAQMQGQLPVFSDERFLRLAQRILTEMPAVDPVPRSEEGEESPLFMLNCVSNSPREEQHTPLSISRDSPAAVEVQLLMLVVNPYSEHQQEAIRYLEFLSEKRSMADYLLYAAMEEPYLDAALHQQYEEACAALAEAESSIPAPEDAATHQEQLTALRNQADALAAQQVIVSQEAIDSYHALSSAFVVVQDEDITQGQRMQTLLSELLGGQLSLEQFAQQADEYVRMRAEE